MTRAPQICTKHPAAAQNAAVSFDALLDPGELLTGTPTVSASPSGVTVDNVRVSAADLTVDGALVPTGRAVQFRASGGSSGTTYVLTVTCGTTSTPAQTLPVECVLAVVDP
ncbi:MAG: hypothetical protein K2X87_30920 [Gemmataceae bacterium]|nr:hypothetical protein [Gemmataceae bacterium]